MWQSGGLLRSLEFAEIELSGIKNLVHLSNGSEKREWNLTVEESGGCSVV